MRHFLTCTGRLAIVAGASLFVAGCGGGGEATNGAAVNAMDSNLMIDEPANDADAMESAVNAPELTPVTNAAEGADANGVLGETDGGDTGGNTVDSNVSGM